MARFNSFKSYGWMIGAGIALAASASQAATVVIFDGGGNPMDDGYSLSNMAGGPPAGIFRLDSNDGTPGSAPGFMYQTDPTANTPDNWYLSPTFLTSEGWFMEMRFSVISNNNNDDGFGASVTTHSNTGRLWTRLRTTGIQIGDASNGANDPVFAYPGAGPFHTLRIQAAPGDTTPDVILDGVLQTSSLPMSGGSGNSFIFGDQSVTGDAQVIYDYVVLNAEIPEPSSLALLGFSGLAMLRNRREM